MTIDLSPQTDTASRGPESLGDNLQAIVAIARYDVRLGYPSDEPMPVRFLASNGDSELEVRVRPSTAAMLIKEDRVQEATQRVTDAIASGQEILSLDDAFLRPQLDGRTVSAFRQALHGLAAVEDSTGESSFTVKLGDGDVRVELAPEVAWQILVRDPRVERLAEIVVALGSAPEEARSIRIKPSDRGLVVTSADGETQIQLP
jgi:hypothetical protein